MMMMASNMNVIAGCFLLVAALLHGATAKTYVVLGNLGWDVPSSYNTYLDWGFTIAEDYFEIGDVLVFNFTTGEHDVAQVTKKNFYSCNGTNPIFSQSTGPANVTLRTRGEHFFICTFGTHCQRGQKLYIIVPPSPPPPSRSSPPNSASCVTVGGFISALLSTGIAFLF